MSLALIPAGAPATLDTTALEEAVLCCLFHDPVAAFGICRAVTLVPKHFRDQERKVLFRVFEKMAEEGTLALANPLTVATLLRAHAVPFREEYIGELLYVVPDATATGFYAEMLVRATSGPREMVARGEQDAQIGRAVQFLDLEASSFLRWPLAPLDDVLGGLAPGDVHWVFAHTGSGKTSFTQTMVKHWLTFGYRVYSAGLEIPTERLRVQTACRFLNLDHGQLFKGNLQRRPDWPDLRRALKAELERQRDDPMFQRLRLAPYDALTAAVAAQICEEAHDFGADVVLIDHVDHLDADGRGGNERAESLALVKVINALTKSYGLRTICTSQTNREGKAGNKLRDHYPLTSEMGRYGDHKIQSGTTAIGLRRPIKPDYDKAAMKEARQNYTAVLDVLAPHTIAANVLKDRHGNLGPDIWMGFWQGEVVATPALAKTRAA